MATLRQLACGQPCQVRLPGCLPGTDTTVLAHYAGGALSGMGMKAPEICGAWACASCHDVVDGRKPRPQWLTRQDVELAHLQACLRTISLLVRQGAVRLP